MKTLAAILFVYMICHLHAGSKIGIVRLIEPKDLGLINNAEL